MKKRIWFLTMGLCIMLLAAGCGKKDAANEQDTTDTETTTDETTDGTTDGTTEETTEEAPVKEAYVVSDYITLGDYKGIEVTVEQLKVTDEDVDNKVTSDLEAKATEEEVTGRAVQDGDIVNIDFEGLKDGVAFEGGTSKDYDLTIGSGSFIEGFEEGLIGKKVGDKVSLDLTFPKEYNDASLAGQAVVFNVTINAIKKSVVPELTDAFVKENTTYDSIDAYKVGVRSEIEAANQETMKKEKTNSVLNKVIENSKISSYPQTLMEYYTYRMKAYYTQYASMYGMKFEDFLTSSGLTEETFITKVQPDVEKAAAQELVIKAIIEAEKIELTDKEYSDGLSGYAVEYGYKSADELLAAYPEDQIKESLLWDKVMNYITGQAVVI